MGCGTSQQSVSNVTLPGKDQYDRKDLIGVGNHGRVYRSIHLLTGKEYAIKVIDQLTDQNVSFGQKERIRLVETLKKLRSPLIAPYYEIEVKGKEVAIVMDLVRQGTLKKYIQKNGKLTEEIASKITNKLLQGLIYLHSNSILHKDLKPSNVLMMNQQNIKLSDYALAEIYDKRLTLQKEKKKTNEDFSRGESLPYMAPEVIKNEGISEKADAWSVGCILIEMITGKVPWSDLNTKFEKAFKQITAGAFPPYPKGISAQCKDFLERCLVISPAKRSTIAELMKHPFILGQKQSKNMEQIDNVKASLQKSDTANRISSRNSNKKQQNQEIFKTPPSIEKTLKDQNADRFKNRFESAPQKQISQPKGNSEQLKKLKQAVTNFGKVKKSRDAKAIHNDDILPEILEDDEDLIMLNNRKVKMHPVQKFKTEQTDSSQKRQYRNSIQLYDNPSSFSINSNNHRLKSKLSNFNQSDIDSVARLETEPILMSTQLQRDHQYFKKPLKLLKKKLKERQRNSRAVYIDHSEALPKEEVEHEQEEEDGNFNHHQSKIRTFSQQSREQKAINTQLAKAERDRYINEQLLMKRQKEKEKAKWQEQLKQESEIIKKEFSHRYAYQRYHPVLNMI